MVENRVLQNVVFPKLSKVSIPIAYLNRIHLKRKLAVNEGRMRQRTTKHDGEGGASFCDDFVPNEKRVSLPLRNANFPYCKGK